MAVDVQEALLLLVVAGVGLGVAFGVWMLARLGSAMASRTKGTLDDKLAKALRPPLAVFSGVVASAAALVVLQDRIEAGLVDQVRRLLVVIFLVLGMWGLIRVVRALLERAGNRHVRFQPAARVGSRLVALFLYTIAFLMVLSVYGLSITPILTGLGIAGLAVALALQDTGANFFAGIWIQTGKSMQPGHYVKIEKDKGPEGFIEEVGWRVTRIRTLSGNTVVVPNNNLAQSIVTDFDLPSRDMSVVMEYRVGLESDPHKVIEALVEEAKAAYKALPTAFVQEKEGQPFAQFSTIDDYAMKFSLIIRVPEFVQQWSAQDAIHHRVVARFRKEGIRIPYPTRHNYQEAVKPEARRVPGAPGGLAPRGRPKPKARKGPPAADPRLGEAEKAKSDIAAKQREKADSEPTAQGEAPKAAEGGDGKEDGKPAETTAKADGDAAAAPRADSGGEAKAGKGGDGGEKPANPLTRSG